MLRGLEVRRIGYGANRLPVLDETSHFLMAVFGHHKFHPEDCLIEIYRLAEVGSGDFKECD